MSRERPPNKPTSYNAETRQFEKDGYRSLVAWSIAVGGDLNSRLNPKVVRAAFDSLAKKEGDIPKGGVRYGKHDELFINDQVFQRLLRHIHDTAPVTNVLARKRKSAIAKYLATRDMDVTKPLTNDVEAGEE